MSILNKIEAVQEWAEENTWFNTEFVDSLEEAMQKYGRLTENQESALDRIIDRFDINY